MAVSFANADVEWEGRVVSAHHKLASTERLMESGIGEPEQWKRYDGEFHQALISNCGSRVLMDAHALVFDKYFRYQMLAFLYRGGEPAAQHRVLLECALRRDADMARRPEDARYQLHRARACHAPAQRSDVTAVVGPSCRIPVARLKPLVWRRYRVLTVTAASASRQSPARPRSTPR
jgi:DNA-binding GntR family transcriptional regulator